MNEIVKHNGFCVPGIGNRRSGRRRGAAAEPPEKLGGSRTKNDHVSMDWIHEDAESFLAEQKQRANRKDNERHPVS